MEFLRLIKGAYKKFQVEIFITKKLVVVIIILCLLLLGFIAIFHWYKEHDRDLLDIKKSARLFVVTDNSSIGFQNKNNDVSGFQYEIIKAFADSLGVELVITEDDDLEQNIVNLLQGEFDIIAIMTPNISNLGDKIAYTTPFFISRQVLVQKLSGDSTHSMKLTNTHQLANDTIVIPKNSVSRFRIANLAEEIASEITIHEKRNSNQELLVEMVSNGKIKHTICEEKLAISLCAKYNNLNCSLPIGFDQKLSWIVNKKSPKLLDKLNGFINEFILSPAYWKIYHKYYN